MSGHGQRETRLQADATRWRNQVHADMVSPAGRAAMDKHRISREAVIAAADRIASYIAAGEVLIEMSFRARRAARFLVARGMIVRMKGDLIQPVGIAGAARHR
jgi:hypothetical protein